MNEIAVSQPMAAAPPRAAAQKQPRKPASTLQWYTLLTAMIVLGWLVRDYDFINPGFLTGSLTVDGRIGRIV